MSVTVQMSENVTPTIDLLVSRLRDKTELHRSMAYSARQHIIEFVRGYKDSRHATADRLGARHSNFVGEALEKVQSTPVQADNEKGSISLDHPWFVRAYGDVTIRPTSSNYLTIPLLAAAYNTPARSIPGLFFWTNRKTGNSFLASALKAPGVQGTLELWYLLKKVVTQAQDTSRMPPDEEIEAAAYRGAVEYFDALLARKQKVLESRERTESE